MTPDQYNTAAALVADSPHFRWRAGMRLHDGTLHTTDTYRPRDPHAVPDLLDPGTVGHLLALYRGAIDDPVVVLEVLVLDTGSMTATRWAVTDRDGGLRAYRPTEGEAVAAALLALDAPATRPEPQPFAHHEDERQGRLPFGGHGDPAPFPHQDPTFPRVIE